MKVDAVVVTYNRKELLIECIKAILNQTKEINRVYIIDNASTDDTKELLEKENILNNDKIIYRILDKNIGGAGGFYEGIKDASKDNVDWIWVMDDDTIPNKECLEELLKAENVIDGKISFLASTVYGTDRKCMNSTTISEYKEDGRLQWHQYMNYGIAGIDIATFVSILINNKAVKEIGLPLKDYFIWGDDTEYTLRMTKYYGRAYLVGQSIAIHKRSGSKSLSIYEEENLSRINFYYYMVRNNYINTSNYYTRIKLIKYIARWNIVCFKLIFSSSKYKFKKIHKIIKGLFDAMFKRYNYKEFKNRFKI